MAIGIDLAHRPCFLIGRTEIRPATLEVIGPNGRERIEPRVMQVLLVLADADGGVVSRDDLTAACWGNRVVGDDAISRVIARMRRLTEGAAAGSFRLETIPKVGYRLVSADAVVEAAPDRPFVAKPPRHTAVAWRTRLVAIGVLAALLGMGAFVMRETATGTARSTPELAEKPAAPVDGVASDLELRGRAALFEGSAEQLERGIGYLREATARDADSAGAWGALAAAYARAAAVLPPPAGEPGFDIRARQAASRALALDPRDGDALAALAMLEPTHSNWLKKDAALRKALAAAPRDAPALLHQRARFLAHVGRTREALAITERVAELHPLVPWVQRGRMTLLAADGRLDEAERLAARVGALWPRDPGLWLDRFMLYAFYGMTAKADAMVADRANRPQEGLWGGDVTMARRVAAAIASGSGSEADAIVEHYADRIAAGTIHPVLAIRIALALDRTDAAMAMAETVYLDPKGPRISEHNVAPLFVPPADRLWSHPRFMPLMEKIGLTDYWRRTGAPDLCSSAAAAGACARYGLVGGVPVVRIAAQVRPSAAIADNAGR